MIKHRIIWVVVLIVALLSQIAAEDDKDIQLSSSSDVKKPVVGVLTLPSSYEKYPREKYSYIASSYVKFLEEAGAYVIPIAYDSSQEQLEELVSNIDLLFFPGGTVDFEKKKKKNNENKHKKDSFIEIEAEKLHEGLLAAQKGNNHKKHKEQQQDQQSQVDSEEQFLRTGEFLFNHVKESNDQGNYFPLWGTCLGFQLIAYISTSRNPQLLSDGLNDKGNHNLKDVDTNSKLFSEMPQILLEWVEQKSSLFYNHDEGILLSNASLLGDDIKVTSTSFSQDGKAEFVASYEFKDYPIYAVQFHPEKNEFEFKVEAQRDATSIEASNYFGKFIIDEAKKNQKQKKKQSLLKDLSMKKFESVNILESSFSEVFIIPNMNNSLVDYSLIEIQKGDEVNNQMENKETTIMETPIIKETLELYPRVLTLSNRKITTTV